MGLSKGIARWGRCRPKCCRRGGGLAVGRYKYLYLKFGWRNGPMVVEWRGTCGWDMHGGDDDGQRFRSAKCVERSEYAPRKQSERFQVQVRQKRAMRGSNTVY